MGNASELSRVVSDINNPIVDGSFQCHVCDEVVDEAERIVAQKIIQWTCSGGHISSIEVSW